MHALNSLRVTCFWIPLVLALVVPVMSAEKAADPTPRPLQATSVSSLLSGQAPVELPYRKVGERTLRLLHLQGQGPAPATGRPAMVWIHGGGWTGGDLRTFVPLARYSALRGAAAFVVEYRLVSKGGAGVQDCVADCRSALRYVRSHARELGIDPQRIAVLGDSAGGHLAACTALIDDFDDPSEDPRISAAPNCMVLFNPLTDFTDSTFMRVVIGGEALAGSNKQAQPVASQEQLELAQRLSPLFRVRPGLPPTLLLHGTADKVIDPFQSIQLERALSRLGNHCELQLLAGLPHAFVIPAYKSPPAVVVDALSRADHFLVGLGFLTGDFPLKALPAETWSQ